jgi:hypothetical protein
MSWMPWTWAGGSDASFPFWGSTPFNAAVFTCPHAFPIHSRSPLPFRKPSTSLIAVCVGPWGLSGGPTVLLRDVLLEDYPPPFPTRHGDARLAELEISSREGY